MSWQCKACGNWNSDYLSECNNCGKDSYQNTKKRKYEEIGWFG
ncbi:MAG: hypothetical protein V1859_02250 [archaeon]